MSVAYKLLEARVKVPHVEALGIGVGGGRGGDEAVARARMVDGS